MRLSERMRDVARGWRGMVGDNHDPDIILLAASTRMEIEADDVAGLEEALAEYENDETPRRRADAYEIRRLKRIVKYFNAGWDDIDDDYKSDAPGG